MRHCWYFCTAMQRLSKKIFPSGTSPSPSPAYTVCSYSHTNTPWSPHAYSHTRSAGSSSLFFSFSLFSTTTHSTQSANRAALNFQKAHITYLFLTVVPQRCKKKTTQSAIVLFTLSYILYPLIHI